MNTNTKYVVDASYFGAHLLPDEFQQKVSQFFEKYSCNEFSLFAPTLLSYEVINILKSAVMQKRLMRDDLQLILSSFVSMHINYIDVSLEEVLELAFEKNITCYDASYVWLARSLQVPLLTLDEKLQKLSV